MIIDLSYEPSDLESFDRELLEDRVSALLRAHRLGRNFLIIARDTANWMVRELRLIGSDRATLIRAQQQTTQTGDLVRRAPFFIRLVGPGKPFGLPSDRRFLELPLDYKDFDDVIGSPVLIVEDIKTDLPILDFIFRNLPRTYVGIPVKYEAAHGGGERIWETAIAKASEHRIVIAVGDSDRKSPNSPYTKADRVKNLLEAHGWPLLFFALTPGAEVENFFGLQVVGLHKRLVSSPSYQMLMAVASSEVSINYDANERFEWFYDFKEGIVEAKLARISDINVRTWIEQKLALAGLYTGKLDVIGFGPAIAKEVMNAGHCMSAFRQTIRSADWLRMFGEFFVGIAWLLAAPPIQRT